MRLEAAAVMVVMSTAPALASHCSHQHFRFVWGTDTSAGMRVSPGVACTVGVWRRTVFTTSAITQGPRNGAVIALDDHHWQYRSRPGFVGQDTFVVTVSGQGTRGAHLYSGDSHLQFDVDVSP